MGGGVQDSSRTGVQSNTTDKKKEKEEAIETLIVECKHGHRDSDM